MARRSAVLEAVAVGGAGALAGALAVRPLGLARWGAVVGACNGALSGWRGVYEWRRPRGWAAATLDSSWNLVGTTAALAVHALSAHGGFDDGLSRRRDRHVYRSGWSPRRGFAFTAGNVVTGAGDTSVERRRQLVERHEQAHVWQQRLFGPTFPLLYGAWMAGGALTGTVTWMRRPSATWFRAVEWHAYYCNPFERWAYARDGRDLSARDPWRSAAR